jgi:pilus assembly protein Flp/PilA
MRGFATKIARYFSVESESGVTAIEYGLLASLVALGIIIGAGLLGGHLNDLFDYIGNQVAPPSG